MMRDRRPAMSRDRAYMRRALSLARKGWGQTAPNPLVGAVVVREGEVVGEGYHARYGGEHAEVVALRAAGERARGATVYVTLEPCAHEGKTPPCVDALAAAGVARVIAATRDPSSGAGGGGDRLLASGVAFEAGLEERAARELNAVFFHALASERPFVTLKLAVSLDAALADSQRSRGWLTGARARREVHRLRAGSDAIAVGLRTAMVDDPVLTVRGVRQPRVPPRRVVFDREARLPLDTVLVRTAREVPTIVVAERPEAARVSALRDKGVEVVTAPTLDESLRALRRAGVRALLIECGAALAGAYVALALVDRVIIFRAPVVLGAGSLNAFGCVPAVPLTGAAPWRLVQQRMLGPDLMSIFTLENP